MSTTRNWYKTAEAALSITPAEFQAMSYKEKEALAINKSISSQTQQLFFTKEYRDKRLTLQIIAMDTNITPEIQKL